jgi:hypothetical protein
MSELGRASTDSSYNGAVADNRTADAEVKLAEHEIGFSGRGTPRHLRKSPQ